MGVVCRTWAPLSFLWPWDERPDREEDMFLTGFLPLLISAFVTKAGDCINLSIV